MASNDRFKEAMDLTTGLALPQDTALPAQRKRHVSLMLKDLVDPFEGGRERAALATVFGVREYTESKAFWEPHESTIHAIRTGNSSNSGSRHTDDSSLLIQSHSGIPQGQTQMSRKITLNHSLDSDISNQQHGWHSSLGPHLQHQHHVSPPSQSYLDPMKKGGQLHVSNNIPSSGDIPVGSPFSLPDIPAVSKFDDWLTTSSQVLSSKARVITPPSFKISSSSVGSTIYGPQQQQRLNMEMVPPLVFLSYPPAIFDLLKSDTDDRIIIWGPDPQFISMSDATTAYCSMTSLQQVSSKLGFSSNTTTAETDTSTMSIRSGLSITSKMNLTPTWISKMKQSIHQPASSSSSAISGSGKKNVVIDNRQQQKRILPPRFGRRLSSKKDEHQQSYSSATSVPPPAPPPMVIQAATVEKLVEKLTLSLDYTFMTDFFLTYRTFISPTQLCKLLILRFQWGLENDEDDRRVVRIRTFVVLRHWLLNYFVHDFISSRELRKTLTLFLNTLPSHSLVKQSTLDQRIVKSLKRVVRRLKTVHYPRSSQRVQVISPPPPNFDEKQARDILHGKLSQGPLRRKAEELLYKEMAIVDNWHHGNMSFQDPHTADIVVVGSSDKSPLPPATTTPLVSSHSTNMYGLCGNQDTSSLDYLNYSGKRHQRSSQLSIVRYATSAFSRKKNQRQELHRIKESYLHRMEQEKRMIWTQQQQQQQQQFSPDGLEHDFRQFNFHQNHKTDASSDVASLDSLISPGTTDDELNDESQDGGTDGDNDSAIANNTLEILDDGDAAQENGTYQVLLNDVAQQNRRPLQTASDNSTTANRSRRRSVYNAGLSDLSPLVSPSGSVIHGPLVHSLGNGYPSRSNGSLVMKLSHGQQLATPPSSIDNIIRLPLELNMDRDKKESVIADEFHYEDEISTPLSAPLALPLSLSPSNQHMAQTENRISKALLENGERTSDLMDPMGIQDEKALVESPTSMSFKSIGSASTSREKLQHRLSHRLINAFRSASAIRPTRAAVVQPEMMMSSTVGSSLYKNNSIVTHSNHRLQQHYYDNKSDSLPHSHDTQLQYRYEYSSNNNNDYSDYSDYSKFNNIEWTPSQSTVVESHKPQQYHHRYHQCQHPDISYLKNIRASLDEDSYYFPNTTIEPEKRHVHHQYHQQQSPTVPELDTPLRRSTDNIPPSLAALFKPSPILQYRSHALAQQFCLVEKWILLQINWEELVHCRWTKTSDSSSVVAADVGDTPRKMNNNNSAKLDFRQQQRMRGDSGEHDQQEDGVQQLINRFNLVCRWVSSEIVRTPSLDERVLVIEKFIRLAQKCHMYSNFATLIQILLGLQSPSVSRLKKTWSRVADSEMRLLEQLSLFTSPMKNWKHIRDSMTLVADEYGMSPKEIQVQLPGTSDRDQVHQTKIKLPFGGCIPFLGLYLSDLVFNLEQPSYLEPNHNHNKIYHTYATTSTFSQSSHNLSPALLRQPLVNFRKHRITATIIKRFLTFRDLANRYSFEQVDSLYSYCFYLDALELETLGQLSLTIEPPPPRPPSP